MTVLKPLFIQSGSHPARDTRLALQSMMGVPTTSVTRPGGVVPGFGGQLFCQQTGSPSMAVMVSSGAVLIPGSASVTQGSYPAVNDASVTKTIAAAHASLARIDIVVARVKDDAYGDLLAEIGADLYVVTGTAASSPSAPAVPANAIKLYDVAVAAAATTITNGNLTDRRVWAVAVGGVHPCLSSARPSNPYVGMTILETDTGHTLKYYSGAWVYYPHRPAYLELTRTAASYQAIPNLTATTLSFNSIVRNIAFTASSPVTTVTIPAGYGGEYLVVANVPWAYDADGAQRTTQIIVDGDIIVDERKGPMVVGVSPPVASTLTMLKYLAAGAVVRVDAFHDAGNNLNMGTGTELPRFCLKRISEA